MKGFLLTLALLAVPVLAVEPQDTINTRPVMSDYTGKDCQHGACDKFVAYPRVKAAVVKITMTNATPVPSPPPAAPASVASTGLIAAIASNFDTSSELVPTWGSGAIPSSAAPDVVGAFRFICTAGQSSSDDPIVYPGKTGASHRHRFFGNTLTSANSTYATLRATGDSTCMSKLNRSGYWQPEMLDGKGAAVVPDYWAIYYKRYPASSPLCKVQGSECVAIPPGLKFIFGYDMVTNTPPTGSMFWQCTGNNGNTVLNPSSKTMGAALNKCPVGYELEVRIEAPDCWDGVNLDSANHRDHVAYAAYNNGQLRCDTRHQKVMPQFTLGAFWKVTADAGNWVLSSDAMAGTAPGDSFHSDFFSAWDPTTEATWTANCIDKLLNCSGGDLGNGKQLRQAR
ncbi:hypothetical protein BH09PSE3_BH09PSE3_23390 [soil metagenome]